MPTEDGREPRRDQRTRAGGRVMSLVPRAWARSATGARGDGEKVAFVLSGGGNQGVAQVGMLRALVERGIVPDVVVGSSAGAHNAAGIAWSPDIAGVERLTEVWTALTSADVFPGGRIARAWNIVRRDTHLFPNDGLGRIIDEGSPVQDFADLRVPLRVVATDLDTGEEVVFASGPLRPALLGSSAIPGVFPIVEHDGRRLVDGGVVNSVPLWHALSGPVDHVYVLNVAGSTRERTARSPLDVLMTSFLHARNARFEHELRNLPSGVDVTVLPRPYDGRSVLDFSGAEDLIEEAYELAAGALATAEDAEAPPRRTLRRRSRRVGTRDEVA
jgi:NTE family protein